MAPLPAERPTEMKTDRFYIVIAAVAALLFGWQVSRRGCPACMLLPKPPAADLNPITPKP